MTTGASAAIRREVSRLARPPVRMRVSEAARQYVCVKPGAHWDPDTTPYMVEPMDLLSSRLFEAVIFAGPAQSGKTQGLLDGWLGYMVTCDPCDMQILQTSQELARDFSRRRVDRMHRNSQEIGKELSQSRQHDNTHDKMYRPGNILTIGWPSISQLSGKSIKYLALTDYDRMPEDIDGEGSAYNLAKKRTTTFGSSGMTLVESSPGFEINDPKWKPATPHEAPPTRGTLSLFNLGDRRRWYWRCPHCGEYYMQRPDIAEFVFPRETDARGYTINEIKGEVSVTCTANGCVIGEEHKREMNAGGLWVPDGCTVDRRGKLHGTPVKSNIASFWLAGAAAAFQSWKSIAQNHLNALREYELTGSEEGLKATVNTDQGGAYLPRRLAVTRSVSDLERRAEDLPKREIPAGVRFLIAEVDIQKDRFEVQIQGWGEDLESWIIDRFSIRNSNRRQRDEVMPVDPAAYSEDWDLLTPRVIQLRYPLADGSGRQMAVLLTIMDSGGQDGVTERAYDYWRKLRSVALDDRLALIKGDRPKPGSPMPRVKLTYPDNASRQDRRANARGEIPVWRLNTTILKDSVDADLRRAEPGPGYMHFPDWLPSQFYEHLTAEVRSENGWDRIKQGAPNEPWDQCTYGKAGVCILEESANNRRPIDWKNPPRWAAPWDSNDQIDKLVEPRKSSNVRSLFGRRTYGSGDTYLDG